MKPLTIVVATDNHYVVLLAALIKSIEKNLIPNQTIDIYIVEDKVSQANKKKLERSVNALITTLNWKERNQIIPKNINLPVDRSNLPLTIYIRLFLPYLVPDNVDKILYLDVDMIVLRDLSGLFNTELNDKVIGAVIDPGIVTFDHAWNGVLNYQDLGLNGKSKYFNSGLMLINTKKWKEQDIATKVIRCVEQNIQFANYPDQYGLNVVLNNQWLELDSRWNHFSTLEHTNPFLIHFVWRKPIYKSYDKNPEYQRLFYSYLNQTKWSNFSPIGETSRYIKKISNILLKYIHYK
jgi:Lipopolysaccharide biosynthesis proteins, LPS:glycosyltransferases